MIIKFKKGDAMKTAIVLFAVLCIPVLAFSATFYVPDHYPTIQEAIDESANGDTIIVRAGIYMEGIDFKGKAITVRSEKGPKVTIIDAVFETGTVTFQNDEGRESVIDGFTLTGAGGIDSYAQVAILGSASPTIINNIITNKFETMSVGIFMWEWTGGTCSPLIADNLITENSFTGNGAGIHGRVDIGTLAPVITRNIITYNFAGLLYGVGGGGGMYFEAYNPGTCSVTATNNILAHNEGIPGKAILLNAVDWEIDGVYMLLTNNTIIDNGQSHNRENIQLVGSTLEMWNSINWNPPFYEVSVWFNSHLKVGFSDLRSGQAGIELDGTSSMDWGPGMINADPLFVDSANHDFHLTYNSPCRDAGDNSVVTELYDFEGDPRIAWSGTVDIGADEFYNHLYCMGDFTPNGSIEGKLLGLPGTSPVGLFLASGVLDPPVMTMWGNFHLQAPWFMIPLVPIPGDGVLVLPAMIPGTPSAPYDLPMQALIGLESDSLTNLYVLEIR
jgi:hypothetical protein